MLSVVMAAAALIALLAFAPFASAASDPLASGTTTLTLNKSFFNGLKKNGVRVVRVKQGTVNGRTVTMRVTGGSLDPTTGKGTIVVNGGIKFKRGKAAIPFRNLTLDTAKHALNGKAGKKKMKLANLGGLTVTRDGFGANVRLFSLTLTGSAARLVNQRLGFNNRHRGASASCSCTASGPLRGQQVMGGSTSTTQPSTVTVLCREQCDPHSRACRRFGEIPGARALTQLTAITPIDPPAKEVGVTGDSSSSRSPGDAGSRRQLRGR